MVGEKEKEQVNSCKFEGGQVWYCTIITRGIILNCVVVLFEFASVHSIAADFSSVFILLPIQS